MSDTLTVKSDFDFQMPRAKSPVRIFGSDGNPLSLRNAHPSDCYITLSFLTTSSLTSRDNHTQVSTRFEDHPLFSIPAFPLHDYTLFRIAQSSLLRIDNDVNLLS